MIKISLRTVLSKDRAAAILRQVPLVARRANELVESAGNAALKWRRHQSATAGARSLYAFARRWSKLRAISLEDRRAVRTKILQCERICIRIRTIEDIVDISLRVGFIFGSFAGLLYVLSNGKVFGISLVDYAASFLSIPLLLFFGFMMGVMFAVQINLEAIGIGLMLLTFLGCIVWFIGAVLTSIACPFSHQITECSQSIVMASSPVILVALVIVTSSIASYLRDLFRAALDSRFPEAVIASRLFGILSRLDNAQKVFSSIAERSQLMRDMEQTGSLLGSRLFRGLRSLDPNVNKLRDQMAHQIGQEIRSRANWLITPKPDTAERLVSYFSTLLVALLKGTWDQFFVPADQVGALQTDAVPAGGRGIAAWVRLIVLRVVMALRSIIVAALPAAGFYYADKYNVFRLETPMRDYVQVGLILWMLIVLLSEFDPLLRERVSTLRDLAGVFRGPKKE